MNVIQVLEAEQMSAVTAKRDPRLLPGVDRQSGV